MDTLKGMREVVIVSSFTMDGVGRYVVGDEGGGDSLISNNGWSASITNDKG